MQSQIPLDSPEGPDNEQIPKRPRLTASQLQRKRELDREAQRVNRAKTKSRIAHLESLVGILQAPEAANTKTNELIAQVNIQKAQIDRLLDALSGISKIVSSTRDHDTVSHIESTLASVIPSDLPEQCLEESQYSLKEDSNAKLHAPYALSGSRLDTQTKADPREELSKFQTHDRRHISDTDSLHRESGTSTSPEDLNFVRSRQLPFGDGGRKTQIIRQAHQQTTGGRDRVSRIASDILQNSSLDGRLWYLAGTILSSILDPDQQLTPPQYGEDIAVRAVLRGWSSTASHYDLDAGWQWLRHLDEALYSSLGIPERLAILRIMRLQFLVFSLWNS